MVINARSIADEFHTATCNGRHLKQFKTASLVSYDPFLAETVQKAPLANNSSQGLIISLPIDAVELKSGLEETIVSRRSRFQFSLGAVPIERLAKLLYLTNGIRKDGSDTGDYRRNVANAGNLGSVEVYCIALRIESVEPGLYRFDSLNHKLIQLKSGNYAGWIKERAFLQSEFADAAALLILTSAVKRLCGKYGARGYRLALMDVGHVSQNIYLVATGLGLDVCATGGFVDCELNDLIGLDGLDNCAQLVVGISQS